MCCISLVLATANFASELLHSVVRIAHTHTSTCAKHLCCCFVCRMCAHLLHSAFCMFSHKRSAPERCVVCYHVLFVVVVAFSILFSFFVFDGRMRNAHLHFNNEMLRIRHAARKPCVARRWIGGSAALLAALQFALVMCSR